MTFLQVIIQVYSKAWEKSLFSLSIRKNNSNVQNNRNEIQDIFLGKYR